MAEAAVQSSGTGRKAGRTATRDQGTVEDRPFGWGGVFVFALCGLGLSFSGLLLFSKFAGAWPGANLIGILTTAGVVALVHSYTYASIGAAVGRNGADYHLVSRVLSRPLAFAVSWTLVCFLALAGGAFLGSLFMDTLPMFARILSVVFNNHLLTSYLETFSSQSGVVLFGSLVMLAVFAVLMVSPRAARYFLLVGFVMTLIGWLTVSHFLAHSSQADFIVAWDQVMGGASSLEQLLEARRLGMIFQYGFWPTTLAGLAAGLSLFFGYFHATNFAGEVHEPQKNLLRGSWTAVLIGWGLVALATFLIQQAVSPDLLSALSYLAGTEEYGSFAMPWLLFYTLLMNPSLPLFWLLLVTWVVPVISLAYTLLYAGSRVMVAWAEDSVMPEVVGFIHPILRSPLIAVLIISIIAEVGLVLSVLLGGFLGGVNLGFIIACVQLLPVLALILLPFRQKEWFKQTPLARQKIGPVPLVSVIGSISLLYLLGIIGATLFAPGFDPVNQATLILLGVLLATGLFWYFWRPASRFRQSASRILRQQGDQPPLPGEQT